MYERKAKTGLVILWGLIIYVGVMVLLVSDSDAVVKHIVEYAPDDDAKKYLVFVTWFKLIVISVITFTFTALFFKVNRKK